MEVPNTEQPLFTVNIANIASTEYPEDKLKALGLENSEIENLRAGFIKGFKESQSNYSDQTNCFMSFIRSNFLSSKWDKWLDSWNNNPSQSINNESWDEKFNARADANLLNKGSVDWSEEIKIKNKILAKANGVENKIDNILSEIQASAYVNPQDYSQTKAWVNPDSLNMAKTKLIELFQI